MVCDANKLGVPTAGNTVEKLFVPPGFWRSETIFRRKAAYVGLKEEDEILGDLEDWEPGDERCLIERPGRVRFSEFVGRVWQRQPCERSR